MLQLTEKINALQTDLIIQMQNIGVYLQLDDAQITETEIIIRKCFLELKETLCKIREVNKQQSLFEWTKSLTEAQRELYAGGNSHAGSILDDGFKQDGLVRPSVGDALHGEKDNCTQTSGKNSEGNQTKLEALR